MFIANFEFPIFLLSFCQVLTDLKGEECLILQMSSLILTNLFILLSCVFISLLQILISIFTPCDLPPFYRYNGIYRTMFLWTLCCHGPSSNDHNKLRYKSVTHSYSFGNVRYASNSKKQKMDRILRPLFLRFLLTLLLFYSHHKYFHQSNLKKKTFNRTYSFRESMIVKQLRNGCDN